MAVSAYVNAWTMRLWLSRVLALLLLVKAADTGLGLRRVDVAMLGSHIPPPGVADWIAIVGLAGIYLYGAFVLWFRSEHVFPVAGSEGQGDPPPAGVSDWIRVLASGVGAYFVATGVVELVLYFFVFRPNAMNVLSDLLYPYNLYRGLVQVGSGFLSIFLFSPSVRKVLDRLLLRPFRKAYVLSAEDEAD